MRLFTIVYVFESVGKCQSDSYSASGKELWIDKHRPRTITEFAVHKKKVNLNWNYFVSLLIYFFCGPL